MAKIFVDAEEEVEQGSRDILCPDCNNLIRHEGGCAFCPNCGWSECA